MVLGQQKSLDRFGKCKFDPGFTPWRNILTTLKEHRSKTTQNIPVLNVVAQELVTTWSSTLLSSNVGFHEEFKPSLKDSLFSGRPNHWNIARFSQCLLQTICIHLIFKTFCLVLGKIFFLLGTYPPWSPINPTGTARYKFLRLAAQISNETGKKPVLHKAHITSRIDYS